jgi:hypothetical protein
MMFRTRLMQDRIREQQSEMMFRARAMQDRIRDQQSEMVFRTRAMQDRIRQQQTDLMMRRSEYQPRAILEDYQRNTFGDLARQHMVRGAYRQLQNYAGTFYPRTGYSRALTLGSAGAQTLGVGFDLWQLRQINRGGKIFDIGDDLKIRWRTARPYDAPLGVGLAYRLLVAAPNPFRERGSYSARVVTSGGVTRWESIR